MKMSIGVIVRKEAPPAVDVAGEETGVGTVVEYDGDAVENESPDVVAESQPDVDAVKEDKPPAADVAAEETGDDNLVKDYGNAVEDASPDVFAKSQPAVEAIQGEEKENVVVQPVVEPVAQEVGPLEPHSVEEDSEIALEESPVADGNFLQKYFLIDDTLFNEVDFSFTETVERKAACHSPSSKWNIRNFFKGRKGRPAKRKFDAIGSESEDEKYVPPQKRRKREPQATGEPERTSPRFGDAFERLAALIENGQIKKVVFVVGAGISTNAGIPDFRSSSK